MNLSSQLSIIVPVRNEEASIIRTLKNLRASFAEAELLVIDGGTDSTEAKVNRWLTGDLYTRYKKNIGDRGKGHAIREGLRIASRRFVAQFDADLQFFSNDLIPMLEALNRNEADFICGSRFLRQSERLKNSVPGARVMGNRAINLYASLWMAQHFTDVLAGVKMWKKSVTDSFELRSDRYCYEVELPIKARRLGFKVIEMPVSTSAREFGNSSVNVLKTGLELLRDIPRFRYENL